MGQFGKMLDQLMAVEAAGFDPYKDSYVSRMAQLQPSAPSSDGVESGTNVSNGEPSVIDKYVQAGFDDPRQTLFSDTGEINRNRISTGYNDLLRDPSLGDASGYINEINKLLPPEEQVFINPDKALRFDRKVKPEEKKVEENVNFGSYYDAQSKKYIYKKENEKTGEVYQYYDSKEDLKKASNEYRQSK